MQQDAVDNLIRVASNELSAAMVDNRLCLMVAGVFNACNTDFLTKIEAHVKLGTDSVVVVGKLKHFVVLSFCSDLSSSWPTFAAHFTSYFTYFFSSPCKTMEKHKSGNSKLPRIFVFFSQKNLKDRHFFWRQCLYHKGIAVDRKIENIFFSQLVAGYALF